MPSCRPSSSSRPKSSSRAASSSFLQTGRGLERERLECQVFERLPADGGKSVPQACRAFGRRLVCAFEQALEPARVDLVGPDTEDVTGRFGPNDVPPQRPPQLGHVVLEGVARGLGRALAPDVLDEAVR